MKLHKFLIDHRIIGSSLDIIKNNLRVIYARGDEFLDYADGLVVGSNKLDFYKMRQDFIKNWMSKNFRQFGDYSTELNSAQSDINVNLNGLRGLPGFIE